MNGKIEITQRRVCGSKNPCAPCKKYEEDRVAFLEPNDRTVKRHPSRQKLKCEGWTKSEDSQVINLYYAETDDGESSPVFGTRRQAESWLRQMLPIEAQFDSSSVTMGSAGFDGVLRVVGALFPNSK